MAFEYCRSAAAPKAERAESEGASCGRGRQLWQRASAVAEGVSCGRGCQLWQRVPAVAEGVSCGVAVSLPASIVAGE